MSKRNPERDPFDRYFTHHKLAQRIAVWANIEPGMRVLEPSAGEGAFVKPLVGLGALVTAVELHPEQLAKLRELDVAHGFRLIQSDFLTWRPDTPFDLAVMNPPFSDGADGTHVAHALRYADRVVVLVRTNFEHTAARWFSCMQRARVLRKVVLVNRPPPFGGPGDRNEGPMSDYVVLELERRENERAPGEADLVAVEYWFR